MVSVAEVLDAVAGAVEVPGSELFVLLLTGSDGVGKVTRSPPLEQLVVAKTISRVDQARLFMAHSYPLRSRHACDLAARP